MITQILKKLHRLKGINYFLLSLRAIAKQSPFSPPLEKGDRRGFEIATLPSVARNDEQVQILRNVEQ